MKFMYSLIMFLFATFSLHSYDYSIVFIHIGKDIPSYLPIALNQARLFNPNADIVLIANKRAIQKFSYKFTAHNFTVVFCESLKRTPEHEYFSKYTTLSSTSRQGFWRYTFERFYYLHEYIQQTKNNHVFHLEYDNMLYCDLNNFLPLFENYYHNKLGLTLDNDQRCIPGFVYISTPEAIDRLIKFMTPYIKKGYTDMAMLGLFKQSRPDYAVNLPIVPQEYTQDYELISQREHKPKNPQDYYQYADKFQAIFDAAAMGQYLGGIDPRNGVSNPGFINESCIFNVSKLKFIWKKDSQQRDIPFVQYKGAEYNIVNLHIHSKKLSEFVSL